MENVKINPVHAYMSAIRATDLLFTGFRRCDANESTCCIITCNGKPLISGGYETEMFIVTVDKSLRQGDFIVALFDKYGKFIASARCDQFDR